MISLMMMRRAAAKASRMTSSTYNNSHRVSMMISVRAMAGGGGHHHHDPDAGKKDHRKALGVTDEKEFVRVAKENIEDIAELRMVGRTDIEAEYEMRTGRSFFSRAPLTGPFGTLKNPVMVPSTLDSRLVGCMGGDGARAHDLLWMEVNAGRKHICSKCGQAFMLDNPNWKPKDLNAPDDHHHHH